MNDFSKNSSSQPSKSDDLLKSLFRAAAMSSRQSIKPRASNGPAPLSASQQQMWFMNQLYPDSPVYNTFRAYNLSGALDLTIFENCINEIVSRHDALRTVFQLIDDIPFQVVRPVMGFEFSFQDLSAIDDSEKLPGGQPQGAAAASARNTRLHELLFTEARKNFDLIRGPCLRVVVFKLEEYEYCFMLTMHHISCDGWSLSVLFRELAALYEAFSQKKESPLEELPIQYADYAVWQQEWLEGDGAQSHLDYWNEQLKDLPHNLNLPVDKLSLPVHSFRGGYELLTIPEQLTERLKTFSAGEGVTLYMTLMAAFQVLLFRYSGEVDIMAGTPIANRNHPETQNLIGCFVNTMAMRTDLSGNPSFLELLTRVKKMTLDAYAYQDLPYQVLLEKVKTTRNINFSPLFQVAFALQNTPDLILEFSGLTLRPLEIDNGTAKFELTLILDEDDGLHGKLEYSIDLFHADTIRRMSDHYQRILAEICAHPDQPLATIPLLNEADRHQIVFEWNKKARNYPVDKYVHHFIEELAEESPDDVAVVYEEKRLSYEELNRRANQLAHYLMKRGVGPDVLAGMCMKRSLESVICIIGILKAGGAYVPLDFSNPEERLVKMIKNCGASILVTVGDVMNSLPSSQIDVISLDRDWEIIECESTENPERKITSGNLAYVIYTSGTTGVPKGVAVEHRQLTNYIFGIQERLEFERKSNFAMVTTFTADLGYTMLFSALCTGGTLHIISRHNALDPEAMGTYFSENSIDYLKIVPSHLDALLTTKLAGEMLPRKMIILGGEASSSELVERIRSLSPGCSIVNHYGPTETTIGVLTHQYKDTIITRSGSLPLGKPLPNTQIYLLDKYMQPVPIGVPGEIYIGGSCLARGYINDSALTGEKFIDNPLRDNESHSMLYKTGDLARYLADGTLEFLGRTDNQVKVRGYRVELSEIQAAIRQHKKIHDALVLKHINPQGHNVLTAYVLPSRKASPVISGKKRYILPNNLAVAHLNKHETDYIYREIFERQAYLRHGIEIKKGDCVFDIGANIGLFALYVNMICIDARIYSFEPNPDVFERLKANAELYGNGISLFNFGLADEEKTADFTYFPGYSLLSGFHADAKTEKDTVKAYITSQYQAGRSDLAEIVENADSILDKRFTPESFSAKLRTLSHVIDEENVECIDLLKINVERSELNVLRGIRDEHWKIIRQIVLEVDIVENLGIIRELLERRGYNIVVQQEPFLENTQLHYIYAKKHSEDGTAVNYSSDKSFLHEVPSLPEPFISTEELRNYLKKKVPDYMIPSCFSVLEEFPLTRNGKVDVQALPSPSHDHIDQDDSSVAPQSSLEETVLKIWKEILKHDGAGIHDDFFDLGGHSLLAMQLISWIRRDLLVELSVHDIFEYSTVAKLSEVILKKNT